MTSFVLFALRALARAALTHYLSPIGVLALTAAATARTVETFDDVKIIGGGITAVVILIMQGINLWRSLVNGKVGKANAAALHGLHHVIDHDIRVTLEILKKQNEALKKQTDEIAKTQTHLEALIERRKEPATGYHPGRRAGEPHAAPPPPPVIPPPKAIDPAHDPRGTLWPIGD